MGAPENEAFSLAQIFFSRFANLFRRRRAARAPGRRLLFETLESRMLLSADLIPVEAAPLAFEAPDNQAADSYVLRLNGENLELLDGSSVILSQALDATSGVVITGEEGYDDALTVDFSSGFFVLADGIRFDGGADGMDLLTVTGGDFDTITHTATSSGPGRSGNLAYDDGVQTLNIDYANLEPIDMTGSSAGSLVFNLSAGGGTQPILEDDGIAGNDISQIRDQQTPARFETMTFSSTGIGSLTLNLLGGSIPLSIASLPDYAGALAVNGAQGLCSVNFTGSASFSTLSIAVNGAVTDTAAANLTVAGAATLSAGSITLGDEASNVTTFGTLQFAATGDVRISEDSSMSLAGVSAAANAILTSSGSILKASGGLLRANSASLTAGNDIGSGAVSSALDIDVTSLDARSGTGVFGDIFINEVDAVSADGLTLRLISSNEGAGLIDIGTANGDLRDGNSAGLNLMGSSVGVRAGRHVGFDGTTVDALEVQAGTLGISSGTAAAPGGDIYIDELDGVGLSAIVADNGAGKIGITTGGASGDITDANGTAVNLRGSEVTLSARRHIGTALDALDTEVGTLSATSGIGSSIGDIHINELASGGSLATGVISAAGGNGTLSLKTNSEVGDITDGNGAALNLVGLFVELSAGRHIGSAADAIETDVVVNGPPLVQTGLLTASAGVAADAGDIYLVEDVSGVSLRLGTLSANEGDGTISLIAAGQNADIIDGNGAAVNLVGAAVKLHAGRYIGFNFGVQDALDTVIDSLFASAGTNATSGTVGEIYIDEREADLEVLEINSTGRVVLSALSEITVTGNIDIGTSAITLFAPEVTIAPSGVLNVGLGPFNASTRYQILGTVNLGGTLEAELVALPPAERATFMTFLASTGDFAAVHLPPNYVVERHANSAELVFFDTPTISIGEATVTEGDSGTVVATFDVTLSSPAGLPVTVDYATADGSATVGDYTEATGTLSFAPGETIRQISVEVNGDRLDELDEFFTVNLFNATNASIGDGEGTGTILDDDTTRISLGDVQIVEGDSGNPTGFLTISLSNPSASAINLDYTTADGSALGFGVDYVSSNGGIVIFPGETIRTFGVMLTGDTIHEGNEFFLYRLTGADGGAIIDDAEGVVTILDDDAAPGIFIHDAPAVGEGDGGTALATFMVTLSRASAFAVSVDFATSNGTALPGDYNDLAGTLTFSPGQLSQLISVEVNGDLIDENDETFHVSLANAVGGTIEDAAGEGTILDDDDAPFISIGDFTVTEGDLGDAIAIFDVELSNPSAFPVSVDFATADGSAFAGVDYEPLSGTLTFSAGETHQQILVRITGDLVDEFDQTFFVDLSNPLNALIADRQALGVIEDNDPEPAISIADASITEGDGGDVFATFTLSLSHGSEKGVSVDYATFGGTALEGGDYAFTAGTVMFGPGETSHEIQIAVHGDLVDELDEVFRVLLSNPGNASILDAEAIGTIVDDDTALVSISDATEFEGDFGITPMPYTITLSNPVDRPVIVEYRSVDNTAIGSGSDYASSNGFVQFQAFQTSLSFAALAIGDTVFEADETFFIDLLGAQNAELGDARGVFTILNDDPLPGIAIDDVTVTEGNAGPVAAVFNVSLSNASAFPVTVDFSTADGSALAGADYAATTGTLTFAAGQTSAQISVDVAADLLDELDETFAVLLSNAAGAVIFDGQGIGTIADDDDAPTLSIGDASVTEGDSGATSAQFVLSLSSASGRTVSVNFASADGTATLADYEPASGTVVFAPGETSKLVSVSVTGDTLDEADETFTVTLSGATNAVIADGEGLGTIVDDDDAANHAPSVYAGADQVVGLQDTHDHGKGHGKGHDKHDEAEVTIAATYSDLDAGDEHTATIDWGDGSHAESVHAEGGSVDGVHVYTEAGEYTVTVTVEDGHGAVASGTLTITVKKPVEKKHFEARKDEYQLQEDGVSRVNAAHGVLANDRLPSGRPVEARLVEGPAHGTLVFNADGSFVYTPDANFHGKDSFWYEFTDATNVARAIEVELKVKSTPEHARRPRIDWDDCWRAPFTGRW